MPPPRVVLALALATLAGSTTHAQLRICEWNVTNYDSVLPSDRDPAFQTAFYASFQGRSLAPDVIIGQEFLSANAVTAFRNMLNSAPGSPGDWAAAPFHDGSDTDNAFFYRTSRASFLGFTVVAEGGLAPNHPRAIIRYDFRPAGYSAAATVIAAYSSHMTQSDLDRRLLEAQRIRGDAEALDPAFNFLVAGDFNIPQASEPAYQELVASQANNKGRFFDPISTPGNWNNTSLYRFVHTQEPSTQVDDRFDQILLENSLTDAVALHYIGKPTIPYSTVAWNDPNHSYRSWGNDGTSFDAPIATTGNTMVGPVIAQALIDSVDGNGHLPVYLDMRVPAKVTSPAALDLGDVLQNTPASIALEASNAGNVALWTANGIATLNYTLTATGPFTAPSGNFIDSAGGGANTHLIQLTDTSTLGPKFGTVVINSDAPDEPVRVVTLTANIVAASCYADCDQSGDLGIDDFICFQTLFAVGDPGADCDQSGGLAIDDFICFQTQFALGC
jgi:hypothetical protein